MLITRRTLLVSGVPALVLASLPQPEIRIPSYEELPLGDFEGDYRYQHEPNHLAYQAIFGVSGRCPCGAGDCRVTDFRPTRLGSPKGFDLIVNRKWEPIQADTWMPKDMSEVPKSLLLMRAHVCAYQPLENGVKVLKIACAIVVDWDT